MENLNRFVCGLAIIFFFSNCENISEKRAKNEPQQPSEEFKKYWYNGEAEITSYKLEQMRYGEMREGTAVNIFVTEDFSLNDQVKTDRDISGKTSVLKLNVTKDFLTGIYPYSIMESTFYPVANHRHALKVSASVQEWCGHTYTQINNRNGYDVISHSYFEGEADKNFALGYSFLENEIWTQLRVNPQSLPVGDIEMIPSLEYVRLAHIPIKAYKATAEFYQDEDLSVYRVSYPELQRNLKIYYHNFFPYKIEKWEETTKSNGKELITTATKMEEIKNDYWNKNSNNDLPLRENLNLN